MSKSTTAAKKRAGHADPTADEAIKKALRSQQARQRRMAGAAFEQMIDESLKFYALIGEAEIKKTPEPMKPIRPAGRNGQFIACYTKQAQPDYKGTLNGGRSVIFDAKHTDAEKIDYSRVTEEQYGELEAHYLMGAEVFILVSFGMTDFYRVPWEVWRKMQSIFGHKHMKKAECEPYRVPVGYNTIQLLDGIERRAEI